MCIALKLYRNYTHVIRELQFNGTELNVLLNTMATLSVKNVRILLGITVRVRSAVFTET